MQELKSILEVILITNSFLLIVSQIATVCMSIISTECAARMHYTSDHVTLNFLGRHIYPFAIPGPLSLQ